MISKAQTEQAEDDEQTDVRNSTNKLEVNKMIPNEGL
jgi:hypothetical protein